VDLFKPEPPVQLLCPGVVRTDLKQEIRCTTPPAFADQFPEQRGADPFALIFRDDGDGLHVGDRLDAHQSRVTDDAIGCLGDQVAAGLGLGQLIHKHLQRPGIHRKEPLLQLVNGGNIRGNHVPHPDAGCRERALSRLAAHRARFLGPGTWASDSRR
jgi:hypothetical protein